MITSVGVILFFYIIYESFININNYREYKYLNKNNNFLFNFTNIVYNSFENLIQLTNYKNTIIYRKNSNYINTLLRNYFLSYKNIINPINGTFLGINSELRSMFLDNYIYKSKNIYSFYEYVYKFVQYCLFKLYLYNYTLILRKK
jgi:hypothetical protein